MAIYNFLINLDKVCDFVPILSTITNLVDIIIAKVTSNSLQNSPYITYIKKKVDKTGALALIPFAASIITHRDPTTAKAVETFAQNQPAPLPSAVPSDQPPPYHFSVLLTALQTGDFSTVNDFDHLQEVIDHAKETRNKTLLVKCFKAACLGYGLVKVDVKELQQQFGDLLTVRDFNECMSLLNRCIQLSIRNLDRTRDNAFKDKPLPENYEQMTAEEKKKVIIIQLAKNILASDKNFQKIGDVLLEKIYEAKNTDMTDMEEIRKSLESARDVLQQQTVAAEKARKEQTLPNMVEKLKEPGGFLEVFNTTNLQQAAAFINAFDINTKFPDLWSIADAASQDKKSIGDIDNNLRSIAALRASPQLQKSPLVSCCDEMREILLQYRGQLEKVTTEQTKIPHEGLKLDNVLLGRLKEALETVEKDSLLMFVAQMAHVTLNGGNNSDLLTHGLEKLRDYIIIRSPRKHDMSAGRYGVAKFIYEYCLRAIFSTQDQEKLKPFLTTMMEGGPMVAAQSTIGDAHFVCHVTTQDRVYTLDSIGSRKTPIDEQPDKDDSTNTTILSIGDKFYASCKPLSKDQISVPSQKENNCYLSAGWLTFCTFLYYYNEANKSAALPQKGAAAEPASQPQPAPFVGSVSNNNNAAIYTQRPLLDALNSGDFTNITDFNGLQQIIEDAKQTHNKPLLIKCLKLACLVYGLVRIDLWALVEEVKDVITQKHLDECEAFLNLCGEISPPEKLNDENYLKDVFTVVGISFQPRDYKEFEPAKKEKTVSIQIARKAVAPANNPLFQKVSPSLLEQIYDTKMTVKVGIASTRELLKSTKDHVEVLRQQAILDAQRKTKESSIECVQVYKRITNLTQATEVINHFRPETRYPDLWKIADFSHNEFPYSELEYIEKKLSPSGYKVTPEHLKIYLANINKSLETIRIKGANPNLHSSLVARCEDIKKELIRIKSETETLIEKSRQEEVIMLSEDRFLALKLNRTVTTKLLYTLEDLERKNLLEFLANLTFATFNGGNNSRLLTNGLKKLREYITNRSPRLSDMERGKPGVAHKAFEFCLYNLFSTHAPTEIIPLLAAMRRGENLAEIAKAVNTGGHFICKVQTNEGLYELDSIGSRKGKINDQPPSFNLKGDPNGDVVCVGDQFYASCKKLSKDHISVPAQSENNCYLSAGWLEFSTFLYYYSQSVPY